LVGFGRIMTGVMVLLGIAWVPFISRISSQLYVYLQSVQGYISPPIAACFILGILWTRLNALGAISSLLTGFFLGALRFILELMYPVRWALSGAIAAVAGLDELSPLLNSDVRDLLRRSGAVAWCRLLQTVRSWLG